MTQNIALCNAINVALMSPANHASKSHKLLPRGLNRPALITKAIDLLLMHLKLSLTDNAYGVNS